MKSLTKTVPGYGLLFLLLALTLAASGCGNPFADNGGYGSISITIDGNRSGGSGADRTAIGWDPATDSSRLEHRVVLTGGPGPEQRRTIPAGGGSARFATVAAGNWTVMVSGWLPSGSAASAQLKSAGQNSVTVNANGDGNVTIIMKHDAEPLTVTFRGYTASSGSDQYQYIPQGGKAVKHAVNRDGYTLAGWYDSATPGAADPMFDFSEALEADIILYAKWIVTAPTAAGLYKLNADGEYDEITLSGSSFIPEAVNHATNNPGEKYLMLVGENDVSAAVGGLVLNGNGNATELTIKADGDASLPRVIKLSAAGTLFTVQGGAELILERGITLEGLPSNTFSPLVRVNGDNGATATLIMKEGSTIKDNENPNGSGGGVSVVGAGIFEMQDGTITGTNATSGGAVYVTDAGNFTMSGGIISGITGTTSAVEGGAVYVDGTGSFTMSAGTISGHTVSSAGGGVYINSGTFTMEGGEISGNVVEAGSGGGVYFANGDFDMSGGKIHTNTASVGGGLDFSNGTGEMSGTAEISGNNTTEAGGGISLDTASASFTMSDSSTITNNTTVGLAGGNGGGGGVYIVAGTLTMNGGSITNNQATIAGNSARGGGVRLINTAAAKFKKPAGGGIISGNTVGAGGIGASVYVTTAKYRELAADTAVEIDTDSGVGLPNP